MRIMAEALLTLNDVRAGYGDSVVLDKVAFELPENGSLAVLGRNGVGKSTLFLTIMGLTTFRRGAIVRRGRSDAMLKDAATLDQFIGLRLTERISG